MLNLKKWLTFIPTKLQDKAKMNVNIFTNTCKKYKNVTRAVICATTLFASAYIYAPIVQAESFSMLSIEKVYHVYIDGERIGLVDDSDLIEQVISEKIKEYEKEYKNLNLVADDTLQLIEELVFISNANNGQTLEKLKDQLEIKAEAYSLEIDGEEVSYVASLDDFEKVVEKLYLQYISKEELETVLNAKENDLEISEPKAGESVIVDVSLTKDIETRKVITDLESVLSVKDTVKHINLGTLEEEKYVVEQGDVLGKIAVDHGLSTVELLELNPSITEDTLLQIGDELNVTVYEPIVKVVIEEAIKAKEEIPFQTETKEDSNMFKGDTKIEQEGQKGERVVSYSVVRENGKTVKREILEEVVTKEPVDRVVVKGTKVVPSRGSGTLAWPAVGGYISSYQGTRWGRFHRGIDIARPTNFNILAADNGTVTFAGWDGGYGNKIIIDHNNGIQTLYAHLASMDVSVGDTVAQGSKIGTMGETGNTTGVHLHFEVYQNGQLKNPMDFLNR